MHRSCQLRLPQTASADCLETGQSASHSSRVWTPAAVHSEKLDRERPEASRHGPEATRISDGIPLSATKALRPTPEAVIVGEKGVRKSQIHASGVSLTAARMAPAPLDVSRGDQCGARSALPSTACATRVVSSSSQVPSDTAWVPGSRPEPIARRFPAGPTRNPHSAAESGR